MMRSSPSASLPHEAAPLDAAPDHVADPWTTYARDLLLGLLVVGLCVVGAGMYLLERFSIQSGSMEPALEVGETVWAARMMGQPERGDIVAFRNPLDPSGNEVLIKRVVGLPGEMIESRDGVIHIDLSRIDESVYLDAIQPTPAFGPMTIGPNEVFVMGDNRDESTDSRVFGPIPTSTLDYEIMWHD